jgi:hypothetical protein
MLYLYLGTDREKVRAKMNAAIEKAARKADVVRITDAHTVEDLEAALQGGGMFGGKRVLVFEGVCTNPDLCDVVLDSLERLAKSDEDVFVFESKPLADVRKKLEKYAESIEKFDAPAKARDASVFAMANALRKRDKKALWVAYMREVAKDNAPEMVHGVLFWAAKDMFLKSGRDAAARSRAAALIAQLAELPHEVRRRGEPLEYALERFALSGA